MSDEGGRRVVLVRHAPAQHRDPRRWPDDTDRPLRPSGRREFARSAQGLSHLLPADGLSATSPLVRAQETSAILGRLWRPARDAVVWPELTPETPASDLLRRAARTVKGSGDNLLLVGHEPQLSRFVGLATTGEAASVVRFSKGGAIALDFAASLVPGGAKIAWAMTRGQLGRFARGRRPSEADPDDG